MRVKFVILKRAISEHSALFYDMGMTNLVRIVSTGEFNGSQHINFSILDLFI